MATVPSDQRLVVPPLDKMLKLESISTKMIQARETGLIRSSPASGKARPVSGAEVSLAW